MMGYIRDAAFGSWTYNLFHTYAVPILFAVSGILAQQPALVLPAIIWAAHIGFDRMLGYGLKLPTSFQDTHLGRIGRGTGIGA